MSKEFNEWLSSLPYSPTPEEAWDAGRAALAAAPVQAVPDGWRLVPVEPTTEMLDAARKACEGRMYPQDFVHGPRAQKRDQFAAMLAAAPAAPQVPAVPQSELLTAISDVAAAFVGVNMKCHPPQEFAMDLLAGAIGRLRNAATALAPGAPQPAEQAPLDVCTDPYNCKRCAAPQWDKHKFEHAGLTSAAGVKDPGNAKVSGAGTASAGLPG